MSEFFFCERSSRFGLFRHNNSSFRRSRAYVTNSRRYQPSAPSQQLLMHTLLFSLLVSVFSASANYAQHHSLPKDIYAFPKYRVSFLKNLSPVENHTALRWLSDGLKGGQQEFLDQWQPLHLKGIESGSVPESTQDVRFVLFPIRTKKNTQKKNKAEKYNSFYFYFYFHPCFFINSKNNYNLVSTSNCIGSARRTRI